MQSYSKSDNPVSDNFIFRQYNFHVPIKEAGTISNQYRPAFLQPSWTENTTDLVAMARTVLFIICRAVSINATYIRHVPEFQAFSIQYVDSMLLL